MFGRPISCLFSWAHRVCPRYFSFARHVTSVPSLRLFFDRPLPSSNSSVIAGALLGTGFAIAATAAPLSTACDSVPQQRNCNRAPACRHRVILAQWPALEDPHNGITSLDQLFNWCKNKGYDGIEVSADDIRKKFFPTAPYAFVVEEVKCLCQSTGLCVPGSLYHVSDGVTEKMGRRVHADGERFDVDFNDPDFWQALREKIERDAAMGNEYINFHLRLTPRYLHTGGEYREDESYLKLVAERIARIQTLCFEIGVNCYFETHMNMVSEDPAGFCRIMDLCPVYFEVNADISHYLFREITRGKYLACILDRVGHHHARLCRVLGDLSADVADPAADWQERGLTRKAFDAIRPGLRGGLSSRCIVGESGPLHLLQPGSKESKHRCALELDAALVPLYRFMAEAADEEAGFEPHSFVPRDPFAG